MKTTLMTAVAALAIAVAAPVFAADYTQLALNAGLSPSEAAGMTREQIAAHYFNRGESNQDRQTVPGEITASPAGDYARSQLSARDMPGWSLRALAATNYNRSRGASDQITVITPTPGMAGDRSQLAASAGLGIDGAEGRSLTGLAATFFNRSEMGSDKQWVGN